MIITARRGGGFAGAALKQRLGPIDTEQIDREVGERIERAVREAGFFDLPEQLPPSGSRRSDAIWHSLEVSDGDQSHTVSWDDNSEVPDSVGKVGKALAEAGQWEDDHPNIDDLPYEVVELEAVHDWMPGSPPSLRVTGIYRFRTLGHAVDIRRHKPQGFNPFDLLLDVEIRHPKDGAGDQIQDVPFEFREDTDFKYQTATLVPHGPTLRVEDVH